MGGYILACVLTLVALCFCLSWEGKRRKAWKVVGAFALAMLFMPAPQAQAACGRWLTLPLRAAKTVVVLPRKMQVNSLERRASRGNPMASARVEGLTQRKMRRGKG
jgi:hypothetical protein